MSLWHIVQLVNKRPRFKPSSREFGIGCNLHEFSQAQHELESSQLIIILGIDPAVKLTSWSKGEKRYRLELVCAALEA